MEETWRKEYFAMSLLVNKNRKNNLEDSDENYQEFEEKWGKLQEQKEAEFEQKKEELNKQLSKEKIFKKLARSKKLGKFNESREFWREAAEDAKFIEQLKSQKPGGDPPTAKSESNTLSANFDGLIDLVEWESRTAFLLKDSGVKELKIVPNWKDKNGGILIPPPKENLPFLLPRGEYVLNYIEKHKKGNGCEEDKNLYNQLLEYHKGVSDLPDEDLYDLLVIWDFHTHLIEKANYSPMLCLFAVAERGKSRTGKGLIYVARRGVRVQTVQDAHIIRAAQDQGATLFFDCMDLWKEAEKAGSKDILLNRFEKGMKVPRVLHPERGAFKDTVYFEVFGATALATNEPIHHILDTRTLPIIMQPTSRRFENDVTPEAAIHLKEQLVAWRAIHLDDELPEVSKVASLRIGDIVRPLHQIIKQVNPERENIFLRLVRKLEAERLSDKSETLEAEIILALLHLKDKVGPNGVDYLQHGKIAVKDVTDYLNTKRTGKEELTYQLIGRRLKALGFRKGSTAESASAIYWDEQKVKQLGVSYGLDKTSETSETSFLPVSNADVPDVTDNYSNTADGENIQTKTIDQLNSDEQLALIKETLDGGARWAGEEGVESDS